MTRYAHFDSSAIQPTPVIGWYDTEALKYPNLPPAHDLLEIVDDQAWKDRVNDPQFVLNGRLTTVGPEQPLDAIKTAKILELRSAAQAEMVAGFSSTALGEPYHYPSTPTDQSNLQASVTVSMIPGLPDTWRSPFWCEDARGTWAMMLHTAAQIQWVAMDGKTMIAAAQMKLAAITLQVNGCATVETVNAIAW